MFFQDPLAVLCKSNNKLPPLYLYGVLKVTVIVDCVPSISPSEKTDDKEAELKLLIL